MKVKLDMKHQWIVEDGGDDENKNVLDITTPHGHQFQIVMNVLDRDICDPDDLCTVSEEQWNEWATKYPLYPSFSWYNVGGDLHIFDTDKLEEITEDKEELAIAHVSKVIYDKTIKYDQECENTRSLQILAQFAQHLLGRPSVMDCFTDIQSSKK